MAKEESLVPFIYVLMLWQIPKNMQYQKWKSLLFFYFYAFCQPPKNQKSISNLNFGASTIQKVLRYLKSQDIPRGFKML